MEFWKNAWSGLLILCRSGFFLFFLFCLFSLSARPVKTTQIWRYNYQGWELGEIRRAYRPWLAQKRVNIKEDNLEYRYLQVRYKVLISDMIMRGCDGVATLFFFFYIFFQFYMYRDIYHTHIKMSETLFQFLVERNPNHSNNYIDLQFTFYRMPCKRIERRSLSV